MNIKNMYKQKKFFKAIYDPLIGKGNNLEPGQYIRVFQLKDDFDKQKHFDNLDNFISYINGKEGTHLNNYFTLSTTDGNGGSTDNLITRTVLGFDFDKKQESEGFNHVDVLNRFKSVGLYYHALVDSGNGYHAYIMINATDNLEQVQSTQQVLGKLLGADLNALKSTQLLRIPGTYNTKEKQFKKVNIIHLQENIKRNSIDDLYSRYCNSRPQSNGDKVTNHTIQNTNIPPCIGEILRNGTREGDRYADLQKIVVTLRQRNKTVNEIMATVKEWAYKSDYTNRIEYLTKSIYENRKYVKLDCMSCKQYAECRHSQAEDPEDIDNIMTVSETRMRTLKAPNRGAKSMNGNDLLIYGILLFHQDGLYLHEIIEELTYFDRDKPIISLNTIKKSLKHLEGLQFIESNKGTKFYNVKPIKTKIDLMYGISYNATITAIRGDITTEELRLYSYIVYLNNKQQREGTTSQTTNKVRVNQMELAKDLGVTQSRVSQMIKNLLKHRVLGIAYRNRSKDNSFFYNTYRIGKIE